MKSLLVLALVLGCGGTDDLAPNVVTRLPDGDGAGSAASGAYSIDLYTSVCQGKCSYGNAQSVCDIGQRTSGTLVMTQSGGHLRAEPQGSALVLTRLDGGIWKDGRFDVGGLATQLGGAVTITARAEGTVDGERNLAGQARARAQGSVEGESLDCTATFELSGSP
jgi:hypothetical protein